MSVVAAMAAPDGALAEERRQTLVHLYRAFNQRDIDEVLDHLAPGVDWANGMTGGRVVGREAVRAYWLKQWSEIDPRVEPLEIDVAPDGSARVRVDQLVRSLDGKILLNRKVEYDYEFDGPFITTMIIIDTGGQADDQDD